MARIRQGRYIPKRPFLILTHMSDSRTYVMAEKRQSESEDAKVEGEDDFVINPRTPHLCDVTLALILAPSGRSDPILLEDHRKRSQKYDGKPASKEKRKIRLAKVSKIICVCVFVCDFECREKKHREHSKCLLLQKRKKRENVSHEWSLLQIQ